LLKYLTNLKKERLERVKPNNMNLRRKFLQYLTALVVSVFCLFGNLIFAQETSDNSNKKAKQIKEKTRTVTIPISFRNKEERSQSRQEIIEAGELTVKENGEAKTILSLRSVQNTPLTLAILIQDDAASNVGLEIKSLGAFIRKLPSDSRVLVGYLSGGSLQVRQKFTDDLEKAANALRIPAGNSVVAPFNPFIQVSEALKRFDSQPGGRRAVLLVSDGVDISRGVADSSPTQSLDLDRAVTDAQRKSVAIYSFYSPTSATVGGNSRLILNGQGSLQRLSDETGGRAFFSGTGAPVSFEPFFRELDITLTRQFALTYLTTNTKKGFYRIKVESGNPNVTIEHPSGYFYKF
jgi:VWFA-related protein